MPGREDLAEYQRLAEPYDRVVISPWLEALIRQYKRAAPARRRRWPIGAALLAVLGMLSPYLLRLDAAAYPADPEKRQALDICARADPTFLRFLASDRESCYRRLPAPGAATDPEPRR
ncbi:MAG: hypothetical protein ACM3JG_19995 [Thiohalocapsa sp.]